MSKEELKPIDVSKYTVTKSGNVIKSEEKETTNKDFFRQNFSEYCRGDTFLSPYWDLFETGYELKQDILSQHILELQADKGELTDRVKELEAENEQIKNSDTLCKLIGEQKRKITDLEAQIEQMKCCKNCTNYMVSGKCPSFLEQVGVKIGKWQRG